MIDFEKKLIYIHISKTGGSSVNSLFIDPRLGEHKGRYKVHKLIQDEPGLKRYFPGSLGMHSSYSDYDRYLVSAGLSIKDFTVFTIIRNPWEKVLSHYYYKTEILKSPLPPFNVFLRSNHRYLDKVLKGFDRFCGTPQNIDYILRFENLSSDFTLLTKQLGLDLPSLPQRNQSDKKRSYVKAYDRITKRIVADAFPYELELGYTFKKGIIRNWFKVY
jgi:sulfotransferase famil protein